MFSSLQEAIDLGNSKKTRENDGGVPVFFKKAVAKRVGEDVEYVDEIWVKIFNKGDPKNVIESGMREEYKTRWPDHWKAFMDDVEPDINGIPLDDFPKMTPAERARCKSLKLRSVEDLANYPDGQIKDLGGRGHALQRAAKEFIDYKSGESITDLKAELAELKKELKRVANSTKDNTERGSGNKSSKTVKRNNRKPKSGGASGADSGDDVSTTG